MRKEDYDDLYIENMDLFAKEHSSGHLRAIDDVVAPLHKN